mmetsp:Transcript_40813/g.117218  ORF Transcript_40813/g.117218 Transcript_40813/m.117218 type:complete len:244 (+) Transcript_40813:670-1401(+)
MFPRLRSFLPSNSLVARSSIACTACRRSSLCGAPNAFASGTSKSSQKCSNASAPTLGLHSAGVPSCAKAMHFAATSANARQNPSKSRNRPFGLAPAFAMPNRWTSLMAGRIRADCGVPSWLLSACTNTKSASTDVSGGCRKTRNGSPETILSASPLSTPLLDDGLADDTEYLRALVIAPALELLRCIGSEAAPTVPRRRCWGSKAKAPGATDTSLESNPASRRKRLNFIELMVVRFNGSPRAT